MSNGTTSERSDSDGATEHEVESMFADFGLHRRDFMKAGMAAGAIGSLSGCLGVFDREEEVATDVGKAEVPPGELDDYYTFLSGGQGGDIRVYGMPSMRQIARIPVFQEDAARGYGHDDETRTMLEDAGGYRWGDTHHPRLSQTDNDFDGRWLFIQDKANPRVARIDLKYFVTDAIVEVPNVQGIHGLSGLYPDTELVLANGEFRVPIPNDGRDLDDPDAYGAVYTAIDSETMDVEWQVLVDGNLDNTDSGKDGRWTFATSYNSDEGLTESEMARADRDWVAAFDIDAITAAVEAGEYEEISGVRVLDGRENSPLNESDSPIVTYVPVPKNPHGVSVTPDGKYAIASGKLDPSCSVIDIEALDDVDDPEDAVVGRPNLGNGPLHTAYDGRGHAYTSLFVDSQVVKWDIEAAVEADLDSEEPVVQKLDVHYSPGHLQAAESYTADPAGDWLLSMNKFSQDRFLPVGPYFPECDQLIDISDDEQGMVLVKDTPTHPEPHDCTIAAADKISPEPVWEAEDLELDYIDTDDIDITREDGRVHVEMYAVRNHFGFEDVAVKEGDEVTITTTNVETAQDIIHSLAIPEYDVHVALAPQETREVTFTADRPGVYWMYCAFFCSALHLEMRSRLLVEPED